MSPYTAFCKIRFCNPKVSARFHQYVRASWKQNVSLVEDAGIESVGGWEIIYCWAGLLIGVANIFARETKPPSAKEKTTARTLPGTRIYRGSGIRSSAQRGEEQADRNRFALGALAVSACPFIPLEKQGTLSDGNY
jgi:hypothetical protein